MTDILKLMAETLSDIKVYHISIKFCQKNQTEFAISLLMRDKLLLIFYPTFEFD